VNSVENFMGADPAACRRSMSTRDAAVAGEL
jgi:hypothetical protein